MNYKKIAKFIKDTRNLIIWNNGREQWISDGIAAYPVLGMPTMNESEMLMFLGLYDQADKISVRTNELPDWIKNLTYEGNFDIMLGPSIIEAGSICRVYYTEQGAIVLKNKYFDAVEHNADEDIITYQLTSDKNPGIAVFIGFDIVAVVLPIVTRGLSEKYMKLVNMLQLRDNKAEGAES